MLCFKVVSACVGKGSGYEEWPSAPGRGDEIASAQAAAVHRLLIRWDGGVAITVDHARRAPRRSTSGREKHHEVVGVAFCDSSATRMRSCLEYRLSPRTGGGERESVLDRRRNHALAVQSSVRRMCTRGTSRRGGLHLHHRVAAHRAIRNRSLRSSGIGDSACLPTSVARAGGPGLGPARPGLPALRVDRRGGRG